MIAVLVGVWIAPAAARADPASSAAAVALFKEGRARAARGDYRGACALYSQSFELDPGPGTALNLGDCAERERRFARAWELFEGAAREFERAGKASRAHYARERATALLARLATVTVRLREAELPGLVVRVGDRAPAPAAEIVERFEPGSIPVEVSAPDREPFSVVVDGAAGTYAVVAVPPLQARATAAPPPTDPSVASGVPGASPAAAGSPAPAVAGAGPAPARVATDPTAGRGIDPGPLPTAGGARGRAPPGAASAARDPRGGAAAPPPGRARAALGGALSGAGLIALGAAGGVSVAALRDYRGAFRDGECTRVAGARECTSAGLDRVRSSQRRADAATWTAAGGAAALAIGAVLLFTIPRPAPPPPAPSGPARPEPLRVTPIAGPSTAGLAVSGAF